MGLFFYTSRAARAMCHRGHLCELVLFSFMVEGVEQPETEDRSSIVHAVPNIYPSPQKKTQTNKKRRRQGRVVSGRAVPRSILYGSKQYKK